MSPEGREMPLDLPESEIFVLLAKRRRRLTLRILRESPTTITAAELARQLAFFEHGQPSTEAVRAIHLALYHNHLPRLDEAEVVEHDPDQGTIRPGKNFDTLVRVLERVSEGELPWSDR